MSSQVQRKRNRNPPSEEYSLQIFDLKHNDDWAFLLDLNGGESAPSIISAPGLLHANYMCCLVLPESAKPSPNILESLRALEQYCNDKVWWPYATRIAIVVPVAIQSHIAMAQGIKRLEKTCPCDHLRGLGMALLANVVRHFAIEYLFMSPIDSFAHHVRRELIAHDVPFGRLGDKSLWLHVTNNIDGRMIEGDENKWMTMREGRLKYTRRDQSIESDVYFLKINPPTCFQPHCSPRTILLNVAHYVPRGGHVDPESHPFIDEYETHDFLWFLAGDGVLVIHGPSLATMVG